MKRFLLALFTLLSTCCLAQKTLATTDEYIYELYVPGERIPAPTLIDGLSMYYKAYLDPRLHEGIPLSELKIDLSRFHSYEEFIEDMFYRDFLDYQNKNRDLRYYFQVRYIPTDEVVSLCIVLKEEDEGFYYMDHIGTKKEFRRRGLASTLVELVKQTLAGFIDISLDTRQFNLPAQGLYEKAGFKKLATHPIAQKQTIYYRYVYHGEAERKSFLFSESK